MIIIYQFDFIIFFTHGWSLCPWPLSATALCRTKTRAIFIAGFFNQQVKATPSQPPTPCQGEESFGALVGIDLTKRPKICIRDRICTLPPPLFKDWVWLFSLWILTITPTQSFVWGRNCLSHILAAISPNSQRSVVRDCVYAVLGNACYLRIKASPETE